MTSLSTGSTNIGSRTIDLATLKLQGELSHSRLKASPISKQNTDKISVPFSMLASFMQRMDQLESQVEILSAMKNMSQKRKSPFIETSIDNIESSIELNRKIDELQEKVKEMEVTIRRQNREIAILKDRIEIQNINKLPSKTIDTTLSNNILHSPDSTISNNEKFSSKRDLNKNKYNGQSVKDFVSGIEMSSLIDHLHEEWTEDLNKTKKDLLQKIQSTKNIIEKNVDEKFTMLHQVVDTKYNPLSPSYSKSIDELEKPEILKDVSKHSVSNTNKSSKLGVSNVIQNGSKVSQHTNSTKLFPEESIQDTIFQDSSYHDSSYQFDSHYQDRGNIQRDLSSSFHDQYSNSYIEEPNTKNSNRLSQLGKYTINTEDIESSPQKSKQSQVNKSQIYTNLSTQQSNSNPSRNFVQSPRRNNSDFPVSPTSQKMTEMSKWIENSKKQGLRTQSPNSRNSRFSSPKFSRNVL